VKKYSTTITNTSALTALELSRNCLEETLIFVRINFSRCAYLQATNNFCSSATSICTDSNAQHVIYTLNSSVSHTSQKATMRLKDVAIQVTPRFSPRMSNIPSYILSG